MKSMSMYASEEAMLKDIISGLDFIPDEMKNVNSDNVASLIKILNNHIDGTDSEQSKECSIAVSLLSDIKF